MSSTIAIADCTIEDSEHKWESVGYTERIDRTTIGVLYECLNCGKTDFEYYKIGNEQQEEDEQ